MTTLVGRMDANSEIFKRVLDDEDFRSLLSDYYVKKVYESSHERRREWSVTRPKGSSVRTLGVDLASQPRTTAACLIEWQPGRAQVEYVELGVDDQRRVVELAESAEKVGLDCRSAGRMPS